MTTPQIYVRGVVESYDPGTDGIKGGVILPDPSSKIPPQVLSILGGQNVSIRIEGSDLVIDADASHTYLSGGHFTTARSGSAGSYIYGLQTFAPVRGSISGQTFEYNGVSYTIMEVEYSEHSNAFDISFVPRFSDRDELDGLIFSFQSADGSQRELAVSDKRSVVDVTPNGQNGSRVQMTAADIWNAAITDGDWEVLEPFTREHIIPSTSTAADRWIVSYNATTQKIVWRAPDLTLAQIAKLLTLLSDITPGGWEREDDIRLYGTGAKTSAYTQAQARALADSSWEDGQVDVTTGVSLADRWFVVETKEEIDWTDDPLRYRVVDVGSIPDDESLWDPIDGSAFQAAGNNGLTDAARRLFYTFRYTVPAGGATIQAQRDKETSLDHITLGDNVIGSAQLDMPTEEKIEGNYVYVGEDGRLAGQHLPGVKQIFAGEFTPLSFTLNSNSNVVRVPLTQGFNLREVTHGEVEAVLTFTIISRSDATVGFDGSADDEVQNIVGVITVEDLVAAAQNIDGGVDLITRDIYLGANVVGVAHVRAAKDANDDAGLNAVYQHEQGGTGATVTLGIGGSAFLRETGVPVLTTPPIFETTLPSAAGYADGTIAYVLSGAAKGVYVKRSSITPGTADTGLAGLTLDPTNNMRQTQGSRYTHQTWARANFNARRDGQAILANTNSWTVAPAALSYIDFNYRTLTRADGQIDVVYSSPRQFQGNLILTPAGQYAITLLRQTSTRWGITGLTGPQVSAIRSNLLTWHDSGTNASTLTEEWIQVAA